MRDRAEANVKAFAGECSGLNGNWIAIGAQLDGVRLPDAVLAELTLHVQSGTFVFGADEGLLTIDRSAHPAAMNVIATSGPNRGRFLPAIFEHAGGMLRICYALSGEERPNDFKAPTGSRRFLVTYRRTSAVA
jgi:uncharacterized protein (TIGR03067 family)